MLDEISTNGLKKLKEQQVGSADLSHLEAGSG